MVVDLVVVVYFVVPLHLGEVVDAYGTVWCETTEVCECSH
jgi:hypothetical protein